MIKGRSFVSGRDVPADRRIAGLASDRDSVVPTVCTVPDQTLDSPIVEPSRLTLRGTWVLAKSVRIGSAVGLETS